MGAALAAAPIAALAGALLFGWFAVRLSGVYLAMLTLAFAQIVWATVFQWEELTGGSNGVIGVWPRPPFDKPDAYFLLTLAAAALAVLILRRVLFAPFGYAMRAGRDNPVRAEAIGIDVKRVHWLGFALAGGICGIAGGLFAFAKGSISPEVVHVGRSIDGLVMVLLADIAGHPPREIWRRGVGRTFQVAATFGSMTVAENVQMAAISHAHETYGLLRRASRLHRERALDLLEQVGMRAAADRPSRELAYGDVKRLELAIALANDPRLLLMDEPTAGMAPGERNELIALVKRLVLERGIAVLFTEHSMDVVFAYADRIVVLARGRLIADGDAASIRDDSQVREVYFGTGKTFEARR